MANVEGAVTMASVPVVPERRTRAFMEVIDVDSLDDDELLRAQRPSQRRRLSERGDVWPSRLSSTETIIIVDSDDEQDPSRSRNSSQRGSRHRIFSPPPPPQDNFVPPVPSIPSRFAGQQSFPMRRLPPPFPSVQPVPDVVRAIDRPLEFEFLGGNEPVPQRRAAPQEPPFPAPAPPSHHVPAMGLGGALISHHRRHGAEEHAARRRAARERALERAREQNLGQQVYSFYRSAMRRLGGNRNGARTSGAWSQIDHDAILAHILAAQEPPDVQFFPAPEEPWRTERREPDYFPFYTHPILPSPGFTADFAPPSTPPSPAPASSSRTVIVVDDSPVASSSSLPSDEATPLLVCAQCLDPLTLNNGEADSRARLWGMRCGHVIDGKCMEKIMMPSPVPPVEDQEHPLDSEHNSTSVSDDNSIRSRLRSYHPGQSPPSQSTFSSFFRRRNIFREMWDDPLNALPGANSRGKDGKGKNKVTEPVVEATHQWTCPVSGCGKVHVSLLIEGKWTMDKEKGAIGIYA